ncbi:MAG: acetate--CoA ligase family protein [Planctomycetota bacterium]
MSKRRHSEPVNKTGRDSLDAVFRPRSIAVVGASRAAQTIGRELLTNLIQFSFEGPVFPVNPNAASVASVPCFPSILSIPGPVDLAVIIVPAARVPAIVEECGRKGVGGIVIISAGFREVGAHGARLEAEIVKYAKKYKMRLIGPNCMGVLNTAPGISMNATFAAAKPVRGRAAFVSQSGALGEAILSDARAMGIGISQFASIGNRCDVSANDLLEYWSKDKETDLILMYLESFGNPRNFIRIAREVTKTKPVITVKGGRSERGSRAATSHTGSLAGRDAAVDAALRQCGVLRVSTMKELFTLAAAFANQPLPKGNRVLIVGNAGGPNILATDACAAAGLQFAEISKKTKSALAKVIPPEASCENPVDLIASAGAERYESALKILFKDPAFDAVIVLFVSPVNIDAYAVAEAVVRCAPLAKGRPVLVVSLGKLRDEEALVYLRKNRLPVYRFPEDAVEALAAMVRYRELRDREPGKLISITADREAVSRIIAKAKSERREMLRSDECEEVLRSYQIPFVAGKIVESAEAAIAAAHDVGYPVVLKAVAEAIIHKTEVGGVRLDLRNADDVANAFSSLWKLQKNARDLKILVQPLMRGGRETIFGIYRDAQFGPLVLFGLGGIFAEALADVQIRVAPLTDRDARELITEISGFRVLAGDRGGEPVNRKVLEQTAMRLSQLALDHDSILELDLNPFLASSDSKRCMALDVRIKINIHNK